MTQPHLAPASVNTSVADPGFDLRGGGAWTLSTWGGW